jgi:hypothetical protein
MLSTYNQRGPTKVLLGNWQEERMMLQMTGVNRCADPKNKEVFLKNGIRVLEHTEREEPRNYRSTASTCYKNPASAPDTAQRLQHNALAPRQRRALEEHRAQLAAEQAAAAAAAAQRAAAEADAALQHRGSDAFRAFTPAEMLAAVPVKHIKGAAYKAREAAANPVPATHSGAAADYTADAAVTVWAPASGQMHGCAVASAGPSFARSAAFTDPYAFEQAATARARRVSVTYAGGLPATLAPGYVRTLVALRQRLVDAAVAAHASTTASSNMSSSVLPSLRAFTDRFRGQWDSDSGAQGGLNVKELRREMGQHRVPLTDAEVTAIVEVSSMFFTYIKYIE